MARNPPSSTDELVLALDLYFGSSGWIDDMDPRVIELSGILNALPHHAEVRRRVRVSPPHTAWVSLCPDGHPQPACRVSSLSLTYPPPGHRLLLGGFICRLPLNRSHPNCKDGLASCARNKIA